MSDVSKTTADRMREFTKDLERMAQEFDKRVATEETMINRLTFILGDDVALAKTVYSYVALGHLSHHGYLRSRLRERAAITPSA
jgi:hypothetical protein